MTRLHDLYDQQRQSPWIDDLRRSYVTEGGLEKLIAEGVRGLTSNPTIMARAIEAGDDYDAQFSALISSGASIEEAYWELVLFDARGALSIFRPLHDESGGGDGFVSVEVLPGLAHDSAGTESAARALHERIAEPNLLVKIPATIEGLPAIEAMIGEGRSVNITLIFSLKRYGKVIDVYLNGLERFVAGGGDPSRVASVASFFVSRVDTEVDRRLDTLAEANGQVAERARALRGKAALAQAKLAYQQFRDRFGDERFAALAAKGARLQRPLWASTSTKNPAYPDLLYVNGLIGPDTVDTMPDATVEAFCDHGTVRASVDVDVDQARGDLAALAEVGISLDEVTEQLEVEGVASFAKSFDEVMGRLQEKAAALGASRT